MELWIRNQDRMHLLKLQGLGVFEKNDGYDISYGFTTYGHYKTKERALEILDEIQNILKPKVLAHIRPSEEMVELLGGLQKGKALKMQQDCEFKELSTYVYEMPEE